MLLSRACLVPQLRSVAFTLEAKPREKLGGLRERGGTRFHKLAVAWRAGQRALRMGGK